MYLDTSKKVKIIKSSKGKDDLTFKEVVFHECSDSEDALKYLKCLQSLYLENPNLELLHGLKDHLSVSFRDILTLEEIRFYTTD